MPSSKKDNLAPINSWCDEHEKPLRARLYFNFMPKKIRRFRTIRKGRPFEKCHLVVDDDSTGVKTKIKVTRVVQKVSPPSDVSIATEASGNPSDPRYRLKLNMSYHDYAKTWGDCDLLLCETGEKTKGRTTLFWIDAKGLLDFIREVKGPEKKDQVKPISNPRAFHYEPRHLIAGLDLIDDLMVRLHLIRQVDDIDWKNQKVHPTEVSLFPTSMDPRGLDYTFRNDPDETMREVYWPKFVLLPFRNQTKAVVITILRTGYSYKLPSSKEAICLVNKSSGSAITPSSFSDTLKGRQKTIKTPRGRISVRYAEPHECELPDGQLP